MTIAMGVCGLGTAILGYGDPSIINSTTVKLFKKSDNSYGNVAALDYETGDYILDPDTGIPLGENSVGQMVAMACKTKLNSSGLFGFGIDISNIKTITNNISSKFEIAIKAAVKHLVDRKLINIVSVSVVQIKNQPGAIGVTFKWTDLTNGETNLYKLI
jgi:hypothetical protein